MICYKNMFGWMIILSSYFSTIIINFLLTFIGILLIELITQFYSRYLFFQFLFIILSNYVISFYFLENMLFF